MSRRTELAVKYFQPESSITGHKGMIYRTICADQPCLVVNKKRKIWWNKNIKPPSVALWHKERAVNS